MSDVLARIEAYKRQEIAAAKARIPPREIERLAGRADSPRGFAAAIQRRLDAGQPGADRRDQEGEPHRED
jgi:indole-3-glycerol phosphate synthase